MENLSVKVNNLFNDKEIILNKEDIVKIVQDAILKGIVTIHLDGLVMDEPVSISNVLLDEGELVCALCDTGEWLVIK